MTTKLRKSYIVSSFTDTENIEDIHTTSVKNARATTRYWMSQANCTCITVCEPVRDRQSKMHEWRRGHGWTTRTITSNCAR